MKIQTNLLIQHIETLLTICRATLQSEDTIRLQQQHFQFRYVDANELILTEITRALAEEISDETVLSYFRLLLRYALIENRPSLGGYLTGKTIELLGGSA